MSRKKILQLLWAVALVVLLVATAQTFRTAHGMPGKASRFEAKIRLIGQLQEIKETMQPMLAAQYTFAQLPNKEPINLGTLVKNVFPASTATVTPVELDSDRETVPGWRIRHAKIDLGEQPVPIATIMKFVTLAEQSGIADDGTRAASPWRLVHFHIWASAQKAGHANGVLRFEALEAITDT